MPGFGDEDLKDFCGKAWAISVQSLSLETLPTRSLRSKKSIMCCKGYLKSDSSVTLP